MVPPPSFRNLTIGPEAVELLEEFQALFPAKISKAESVRLAFLVLMDQDDPIAAIKKAQEKKR